MNLTFLRLLRLCKIAKAGEFEVGSIPASWKRWGNWRLYKYKGHDEPRRFDLYSSGSLDHAACVGISLGGNNIQHWSWRTLRGFQFWRFMDCQKGWTLNIDGHLWTIMNHHQLKTDLATRCHQVLRVLRTLRFFRELRLMLDCVLGSVLNAIWRPSQTHWNSEVYGSMDEV